MQKDPKNKPSSSRANSLSVFDIRLMEMMASRICHDMAGSINAMTNGIDLFEQETDSSELLGVLKACSEASVAKAKFFRLAYGQAGNHGIPAEELIEIIYGIKESSHIEIQWYLEKQQIIPGAWGKIVLLVTYFFLQSGARGCSISAKIEREGNKIFAEFSIRGEELMAVDEFTSIFGNNKMPNIEALTPYNSSLCYLRALVDSQGSDLKVISSDNKSVIVRIRSD